ncbi:MAG: hypothetical protein KDC76_14470, partial [Bacteroidetes bacterium]|nr:hypothetical protein [Bacteroidota bacterium]
MKHLSLLITAVIILTAFSVNRAFSQCVISFPYTEDFESFDSFQTTASCDLTVYGATANNWTQDQSDGGEWRADSAGTGSNSTGPGSTLTSSGNGVGTDYAPGTTSGTYMYTEASSATSCEGAFVNLVSPCMDFSGSGKYYRMYFAYHMFGGSFGSLHVDVHDGTTWTDSVWSHSGAAGTNWQLAEVDLSAFNGSAVQIRIRAVLGANFYSDCAIDAIRIEAYAQDYDGALYDLSYDHGEYHYVPVNHAPNYDLVAQSRNSGLKSISDVVVKYTGGSGSQTDSTTVGSMNAFGKDTSVFTGFTPSSLADSVVNFELTLKETDGVTSNNTGTLRLNVTEGMYSRDRGNISGGIGANTGTIQIGNMFELLGSDTLQSVDVFLNGTVAGDSIKVKVYGYSSGTPGTSVLATSKTVISSGNREWRTVKFP